MTYVTEIINGKYVTRSFGNGDVEINSEFKEDVFYKCRFRVSIFFKGYEIRSIHTTSENVLNMFVRHLEKSKTFDYIINPAYLTLTERYLFQNYYKI